MTRVGSLVRNSDDRVELIGASVVVAVALISSLIVLLLGRCNNPVSGRLLVLSLVLWFAAVVVVARRRRRDGGKDNRLAMLTFVCALVVLGACGRYFFGDRPLTYKFLGGCEDSFVITNAGIFVPAALADELGVDSARVECVVQQAGIEEGGWRAATAGEVRAAAARCGVTDLTATHCGNLDDVYDD